MTPTLHLSDIQKELLAKVKAAPNPHMAYTTVADAANNIEQNFSSARDTLNKLGIITVKNGEITINDESVLSDEGIIDELGELTDIGKHLAYIDRREVKNDQSLDRSEQSNENPTAIANEPPMESLSLFRTINDKAELIEQIKNFNKNLI